MVNVSQLLAEQVERRPAETAVVEAFDGCRSVTWADLDALSTSVASWLSGRGAVAGHRVGIALGNGIEFVTVYLAALRLGLVAVPMNPRSSTDEFARVVEASGTRVVFCDAATQEPLRTTGVPLAVVGADADRPDETAYTEVLASAGGALPPAPHDPELLATLLFTSGTSRRPRGVMLTHRALLANIEQVAALDPAVMTDDDVVLAVLPMFHIYGLNCVLGQVLRTGATLVAVRDFDAQGTLAVVAEHGVTNLPVAPQIIDVWSRQDNVAESTGTVRRVLSGASALDPEVAGGFAEVTGVAVEQGYGLTETAPVVAVTLASEHRAEDGGPKVGSVGAPLAGIEVKLVEVTGAEVEQGDPGEIWVRGDNLFSGYWPDGEGGPNDDGWYPTGDVAVIDEDGDLTLVDRLQEIVIVSGFNVYPAEVEEVVAELGQVAEVAVIAVRDADTGEAVRAIVVPADASAPPEAVEEEVRVHCRQRLARFKWPRDVVVTDGLPHSATGKVAKGRLRAQARADVQEAG